jgi:hypothetical protein
MPTKKTNKKTNKTATKGVRVNTSTDDKGTMHVEIIYPDYIDRLGHKIKGRVFELDERAYRKYLSVRSTIGNAFRGRF